MGNIPRDILMFINTCENKRKANPDAKSRAKLFLEIKAILIILKIRNKNMEKRSEIPIRPVSSAIAEKIKSVCDSGKKPYWA